MEYLQKEIEHLQNAYVIVCLGKIAFDAISKALDIKM